MSDAGNQAAQGARQFSSDPIIRAAQELTVNYPKNRDFAKLTRSSLGRRYVYPVSYIGEDDGRYISYVLAKGDSDKEARGYFSIEDIVSNNLAAGPVWTDAALLKLYTLIALGVGLTLASVALAFAGDKSLLPVFTGLLGSIIGYFIGERPSPTSSNTTTT